MKEATKVEFAVLNDGRTTMLRLGGDHCSEHEWGVGDIREAFGLSSRQAAGCESVPNTEVPARLYIHANALYMPDYASREKGDLHTRFNQAVEYYSKEHQVGLAAVPPNVQKSFGAWDDMRFLVIVRNEMTSRLRDIVDAINKNDCAIFIGAASNPFSRGPLTFAISSRMEQAKAEWKVDNKLRTVA